MLFIKDHLLLVVPVGVSYLLAFLHDAFGTYYLPLIDWLIVGGLALTIIPVLEIAKWIERKGWLGKTE